MAGSRLRQGQIQVGQPMPFDAFDGHGRLLLRKGTTVYSGDQLERLIDEGLYQEEADAPARALVSSYLPSYTGKHISVTGLLRDAMRGLQSLLTAPEQSADLTAAVLELVQTIRRACKLDADAAIGCIAATRGEYYPARHPVNCAALLDLMLTRAGADAHEVDLALAAALTMNLTIVELQNALYAQQAAPTPEQQAQIDVHPDAAVKQLLALGVRDPLWLATVAQHHETHNGSGYPKRLAGDAIIRPAQWLLLADQYCALVSERAYRPGVNPATVMQKLREKPSPAFAPAALETLRQVVGTYPPGSVVELASREIALVTTRTQHPEHPIAVAIINDMGKRHEAPRKRPTSKPPFAIQKPLLQNALNPFPKVEELWHEAYVANG